MYGKIAFDNNSDDNNNNNNGHNNNGKVSLDIRRYFVLVMSEVTFLGKAKVKE